MNEHPYKILQANRKALITNFYKKTYNKYDFTVLSVEKSTIRAFRFKDGHIINSDHYPFTEFGAINF